MSRGYFRMPIDTSRVHHSPFAEAGNALPVFFKWREKKNCLFQGNLPSFTVSLEADSSESYAQSYEIYILTY